MSQMLKSSGAMGIATLASRFLGMAREIVYAGFMGDGVVAGAFKAAFMIPNLFRRLLGEGALTAAFIPIFKEKERTEGEREMWRAANAVISGLVVTASVVIGIVLIGISAILTWDTEKKASLRDGAGAPVLPISEAAEQVRRGLTDSEMSGAGLDAETRLILELSRVMFPYMLLVCLAAVLMGMLNARGHFFIPAMGAAVLNLVLIGAVLFFAPWYGRRLEEQIFAVAIGVLVAGVAQMLYQMPLLWKEGYRYRWVRPWGDATVGVVLRRMVPGMMGVAAFQLNVLLTMAVAVAVDPRIFASFDYAVRLMELPQGVFGISLATYLLPTLSGFAAEKRYPEFRATLQEALGYLVFANLFASVLLIALAEPIVRLLFERGAFGPGATERAAFALAWLAPGLLAFSGVNILARAFYALGDTKTPMRISCFCLGLNLVIMFWLITPFQQGGLAMANTCSAFVNVWLLFYGLRKKMSRWTLSGQWPGIVTMLGAAVLSGQAAWISNRMWQQWIGREHLWERAGAVLAPMLLAAIVYGAASAWLGVPQARVCWELIRRKVGK